MSILKLYHLALGANLIMVIAVVYSLISQVRQHEAFIEMLKSPGVTVYVYADGAWHKAMVP